MPHTPDLFSTMPTKPWLGGQLPSDPQARGPSQASGIDVARRKSSKRCESLEPRGVRRPWN